MRVLFFNMNEDLELKNFFIQSIEKKFKDDDINFNDVEIYKSPYHYRVSCTLMFDYTTNTNSLFFSQKLSIYEKFPFEISDLHFCFNHCFRSNSRVSPGK